MNLTSQPVYQKGAKRRRVVENDDAYCAWLREQVSAFSGKWPTVSAHYRTAANSGIAIKPLFSAIPLTRKEHAEQHGIGTFQFASREWWIAQVKHHQQRFINQGGIIPERYRI